MEMEFINATDDKHKGNTNIKNEYMPLHDEETRRTEALNNIFNTHSTAYHIADRAGENDMNPDHRINEVDDFSHRSNFDITSEFGGAVPESLPDMNIYQNKKTVAQGMMDLALFSANANQLRYVLESDSHPYFYPGIIMISISLIFQVAVGVGLLLNTRYNVKSKKEICIANKINNFTIIGIFLVTVINVFISAFGVATNSTDSLVNVGVRFGEEDNITTTMTSIE